MHKNDSGETPLKIQPPPKKNSGYAPDYY